MANNHNHNNSPGCDLPADSNNNNNNMVALSHQAQIVLAHAGANPHNPATVATLAQILNSQHSRQQQQQAALAHTQHHPLQLQNIPDDAAAFMNPHPFRQPPSQQQQQPNSCPHSGKASHQSWSNPASHNNAASRPPPHGQSFVEIITFNVLNHVHYERHCSTPHKMDGATRLQRLERDVVAVVASNPNVGFICFQEVNPRDVHSIFLKLDAMGFYTLTSDGGTHCTDCVALSFRSARFKTVGHPVAPRFTNSTKQLASGKAGLVQLFEDSQTNILFAVASVHIFWEKDEMERRRRLDEMLAAVAPAGRPGMPARNFVIAGDLNIDSCVDSSLMVQSMRGWIDVTDSLPFTAVTSGGGPAKLDYVFCQGPNLRPAVPAVMHPGSDALLLRHDGNTPLTAQTFPSDHCIVRATICVSA